MGTKKLSDRILQQAWKLNGTPKTIIPDQRIVLVIQVTKEHNKHLGIQLHWSKVYHRKTDEQMEITNKDLE